MCTGINQAKVRSFTCASSSRPLRLYFYHTEEAERTGKTEVRQFSRARARRSTSDRGGVLGEVRELRGESRHRVVVGRETVAERCVLELGGL